MFHRTAEFHKPADFCDKFADSRYASRFFKQGFTMALAIFDLDNTLLGGDSDHAWGEFVAEQGIVDGEEFQRQNDLFYQQYQRGQLDIDAYLHFALAPLIGRDPEVLRQWHRQFMEIKITPMLLPKAEQLLDKHREQGDYLLIMTSTNSFVTAPIAQLLGVDEILASDGEIIDGRYTGAPIGTPCFQEGKVTRLNQWLEYNNQSLDGAYFYSDSHNDLPLLEVVDKPVAVDPDDTLRQHAEDKGWAIMSLRD